jgi:membrane protein involved in D-alanine export
MWYDKMLPFSSQTFFLFMGITVLIVLLSKSLLQKIVPYRFLMVFISLAYIFIWFPKPFHLLGLILYSYLCLSGLRRWYKSENIVLPMVLLSLPMLMMKFFSNITFSETNWWKHTPEVFQIAGISYLVFRVIGLYIDERSKSNKINFLDFFNFTSFVPTLLIGPLDRFQRFTSDVKTGYQNITSQLFLQGWNNFLTGLLYKFILAEAINSLVLLHLVNDGSILYHVAYMYTYLFYLFFDFAGYSLLAIAFGNFIGIQVPINFDKPFLAVNPKEFWQKWHKSLGDWLNDYFFKPLFKFFTQKKYGTSIQRQNAALFLTFTLMGFWNGFQLHFIVSGMLFGLYSMLHNYYFYQCKKQKKDVVFGGLSEKWIRIISIFIMFNTVAFAIYIFSGKLF